MKKMIILMVIFVIVISLVVSFLLNTLNNELNKYKAEIGERIILKNDTLTIVDYSILESNFTLEDGRKVSFSLIDKLEHIDINN